jgi:hypothetical protein
LPQFALHTGLSLSAVIIKCKFVQFRLQRMSAALNVAHMTAPTCTSSHRMSPLPPGLPGTLATLLAGQPDYHVTATNGGGRFRYE